ncbi:MAG: hypothetical protein QXY90_04750 [Candidatus Anstonellales archaeon]
MNVGLLVSHDYLCLHVHHAADFLAPVADSLAVDTCVVLARLADPVYLVPRDQGSAYSALPEIIHSHPPVFPQSTSDREDGRQAAAGICCNASTCTCCRPLIRNTS